MDSVLEAWQTLYSLKLREMVPCPPGEAPALICSNNTRNGELLFPKEIAKSFLRATEQKEGAVVALNKSLDGCGYPEHFFSEFTLNQKQHLFIRLNRSFVFKTMICQVISSKDNNVQSDESHCITLVPHVLCNGADITHISVSESRSLLTVGLLRNVLKSIGKSVDVYLSDLPFSQLPSSVRNLFSSFFSTKQKRGVHRDITAADFITSLQPLTDPPIPHPFTNPTSTVHSILQIDVKSFAIDQKLIGKGGYEKNLNSVQVTTVSGQLTPAASLAHDICTRCSKDHMIIHVAQQQRSYQAQQAMVLVDIFNSKSKSSMQQQHIALTSAVDVLNCPGSTVNYSLSELLRIRQEQMTSAFTVKYSDTLKGDQLQLLVNRMTEAVIKFELLSQDPTTYVKIDAPEVSVSCDDDVRFDGAFVLYNYARVAALLNRHRLASQHGVYPLLPSVETVDFSLLKEEEEWQLLFHYVLQYPLLLKEAAKIAKKGVGVHITLGLKKICQFLTRFSHAFSSYYSRTKVLMPPEPHLLPLIHARLYLLMAIKQVLHNGLALLAIEPFEQM
ncbi:DALR anticodon-binding domain-containing protein 3-like [Halichondria panicea]|uniref:DALR anticodon-binding domain-containing protein 3-like n=1 Tax=Halichondria panicea TaxID=6063 RepID=UPI00312B9BE4